MATPALVVDEEAVFDTPLDGLLGCFHHLCRHDKKSERVKTIVLWDKAVVQKKSHHANSIFPNYHTNQTSHFFNPKVLFPTQNYQTAIKNVDAQIIYSPDLKDWLQGQTSEWGELTQYTSAELPRRLFNQHLLDRVSERPKDEYWSGRGALHLLDPLVCQAHTVWHKECTDQSNILFRDRFSWCHFNVCCCFYPKPLKLSSHHQEREWSLCWWRPEPPSLCCLWSCCVCVSVSSWRRICGPLQRASYWSLPSFLSHCVCGKTLGPSYTTQWKNWLNWGGSTQKKPVCPSVYKSKTCGFCYSLRRFFKTFSLVRIVLQMSVMTMTTMMTALRLRQSFRFLHVVLRVKAAYVGCCNSCYKLS